MNSRYLVILSILADLKVEENRDGVVIAVYTKSSLKCLYQGLPLVLICTLQKVF